MTIDERMRERWVGIEAGLSSFGLLDYAEFQPPASEESIAELEALTGVSLPASLKASLRVHDGQRWWARPVAVGRQLLSCRDIGRCWKASRMEQEERRGRFFSTLCTSEPSDWIKTQWTNRLWIPLTHDYMRNYIGLDLDPGSSGRVGQVINFGSEEYEKRVLAPDFETYMARWQTWLETEAVWIPQDDYLAGPDLKTWKDGED